MNAVEDIIRKKIDRANAPLEFWGCTNSPIYYAERFHTDSKCPNKIEPDMEDRAKWSNQ